MRSFPRGLQRQRHRTVELRGVPGPSGVARPRHSTRGPTASRIPLRDFIGAVRIERAAASERCLPSANPAGHPYRCGRDACHGPRAAGPQCAALRYAQLHLDDGRVGHRIRAASELAAEVGHGRGRALQGQSRGDAVLLIHRRHRRRPAGGRQERQQIERLGRLDRGIGF